MRVSCEQTRPAIRRLRSGFCKTHACTRLTWPVAQCGSVRILVVEDEAGLREGIVDLLEGDDHVVTAVGDGVAGVETGSREFACSAGVRRLANRSTRFRSRVP